MLWSLPANGLNLARFGGVVLNEINQLASPGGLNLARLGFFPHGTELCLLTVWCRLGVGNLRYCGNISSVVNVI